MNYEILFVFIVLAIVAGVVAPPAIKKFRYVFCVPEGWTGLVYQHGLYVRRNNAGRHVMWGRGWTMNLIDLRKASLLVAGQEVLLLFPWPRKEGPWARLERKLHLSLSE